MDPNTLIQTIRYPLHTYWLGKKRSPETIKKMSENSARYWLGKKRSPESIQKTANGKRTGKIKDCLLCKKDFYVPMWWAKRAKYCSQSCYWKNKEGTKPWNDKGITPLRDKLRKTKKYKDWQLSILLKNNFTCQSCNERGGQLTADHIKPFALFPELRFDKSNGQTLCRKCHDRKTAQDWKLYPMWHGGIYV